MKTKQIETIEKSGREVARPLKILVPLINEDIRNGDEAGLPYYVAAGEKLIEAKNGGEIKHGGFERWAEKKFNRSKQTLCRWMKLSKRKSIAGDTFDFSGSIQSHLYPNRNKQLKAKRSRNAEIWEEVKKANPERMAKILREEKESNAEKAKIEATRKKLGRELALKLIKIGYRALATELHPDKSGNGSQDAMSLLNDVASYLRGWANEYQG